MELTKLGQNFNAGKTDDVLRELRSLGKRTNFTYVAKKSGLSRTSLYKALNGKVDPRLTTFVKLLRASSIEASFKLIEKDLEGDVHKYKYTMAQRRVKNAQRILESLQKKVK